MNIFTENQVKDLCSWSSSSGDQNGYLYGPERSDKKICGVTISQKTHKRIRVRIYDYNKRNQNCEPLKRSCTYASMGYIWSAYVTCDPLCDLKWTSVWGEISGATEIKIQYDVTDSTSIRELLFYYECKLMLFNNNYFSSNVK